MAGERRDFGLSPWRDARGARGRAAAAEPRAFRSAIDPAAAMQRRLEAGEVVVLPRLAFELGAADPARFAAAGDGKAKNVSFNPMTGVLKGAAGDEATKAWVAAVLEAYAGWAWDLVCSRLPAYARGLALGKTSFRPRPADHAMSPRKDDRRLHIDAFPAQPTQGRRILRVFRNLNPSGEERVWQVGEPFGDHAARFLPEILGRRRWSTPAWALQALGLTRGRRTHYDALMLALHDAAKADAAYQAETPHQIHAFSPGATWLVLSDAVPHAALAGRFAVEQTFFLPVQSMADPDASPLHILERMTGRRLA
jgi:hypothetical protein